MREYFPSSHRGNGYILFFLFDAQRQSDKSGFVEGGFVTESFYKGFQNNLLVYNILQDQNENSSFLNTVRLKVHKRNTSNSTKLHSICRYFKFILIGFTTNCLKSLWLNLYIHVYENISRKMSSLIHSICLINLSMNI